MPSNRPNLTLDEQSFQGLLSAAFTIQQHNDRRKLTQQASVEPEADLDRKANVGREGDIVCPHCGALKPAEGSQCESCGSDELRPGERLQRNWASMWTMNQQQNLWPERSPEIFDAAQEDVPPPEAKRNPRTHTARDFAASDYLAVPVANQETISPGTDTVQDRAHVESVLGKAALEKATSETKWAAAATENEASESFLTEDVAPEDSELTLQPFRVSAGDDSGSDDLSLDDSSSTGTTVDSTFTSSRPLLKQLADLRVTLRFRRADLYLGAAVFVAALALLWPAAGTPQRTALGPWERALVTLGIAEAPAPVVHLQGDPGIEVWVDPHTALYYCAGEEPYGKTPNGRLTSQHDAQLDRFEPANRSACE
jgi:ribosomal protein L40E